MVHHHISIDHEVFYFQGPFSLPANSDTHKASFDSQNILDVFWTP